MQGATLAPARRTRRADRLLGAVRLLHPFPTVLNAVVVGALACVAVRGWPGAVKLLSLMATMLCIQAAIGALNDWADRALDAVVKPAKPIARGLVSPSFALGTAVILGGCAALLASRDGAAAWSLAMLGFSIGIAYDLGLKRTPFSAITYALALPLVPLWVWTALGRGSLALAAVLPVGFLLGCSLQLANALPDADGDARAGVRGTLQWLGAARGRRLAWLAFGAGLALAGLQAPLAALRPFPFLPCWIAAGALLAGAILLYRKEPSVRSLQRGWSLLAPAAGLLAVGWLGSLP